LQIKRYTPRAQQLFNITGADIGRPLEHFTHKLDYQSLTQDAGSVLRTLQPTERETLSADGRFYLLRLAPYRTLDDKIDGVVLTLVDMTRRKQSEDTVRHQAETLRERTAILNLAYVLVLDEDWRIQVWSAGCERLYGFSSEEAVGQLLYELLKTEFAQSRESIIEQLQRTGQWEGEFVNTTKSGNALILASHLIFHRREPEQPPVILMVNNDVTASRLAEEELREADRKKDRFLATLAHELRNPLAAMFNSATILQQESADPRALELARNVLHRQLNHLMRLVDDLLDVERLIHGKIKLEKRPIRLSEVFEGAVETCRKLIKEKNQSLSVSLPPEPLIIEGDVTRLSQIVANLLHNSAKYTSAGGKIDLVAEHLDSQVLIRVRDNGIGIKPEALAGIFEMYSQQTVSGENGQQGLGIGLSLVRELTELHGGAVSAASEGLGKGSEFIIRLPLNTTRFDGHLHVGTVENADEAIGSTRAKRVLLVEDNRDVADATAQVLSSEGHQVTVAYGATRALQLIDDFKPEIAILDIGLPEMDGYALAKQIRSRWPHITLIALSGWRGDSHDPRAREAGFSHYFTKPLDPLKLSKHIAQV
jgi:two-component system CheB/CheR fusion protein